MRLLWLRWLERREGRFLAAESVVVRGSVDTKWLERLWLHRLIEVLCSLKDVWVVMLIAGLVGWSATTLIPKEEWQEIFGMLHKLFWR